MKIATPSLSFRLRVIERLLRCRFWKSGPWRGPPIVSLSMLVGVSILMTSAPKSASCRTQVGPARTRERSRTRKRASAVEAGTWGMSERDRDGTGPYNNLSFRGRNVGPRARLAWDSRSGRQALRHVPDGVLARDRPRAALPERVRARPDRGGLARLPDPGRIRRRGPPAHCSGGDPRGDPEERREQRRLPRADVHHGHGAAALQRGAKEKIPSRDRERRAAAAGIRHHRAHRR